MDFAFGGVGLAPHHYVEIKKNPIYATLGAQPQRLLILKPGEADLFVDLGEEKIDLRFVEEKRLVREVNPMLSIFGIVYKDIKTALPLVPEVQFTQLVWLGEAKVELVAIHNFLTKRWESPEEIDGHLFLAKSGTLAEVKKFQDMESYQISIVPTFSLDKKDETVWALTLAAVNAKLATSPQKPYTQVELSGLVAPPCPPKLLERNELLTAGISTIRGNGKQVLLDRLVTTQSKDKDACFRDVNTKQILSCLRYDLKNYFSTIFSRSKF